MSAIEQATAHPNIKRVTYNSISWLDLVRPTTADLEYLRQVYDFHPLALEDAIGKVQLPKLDQYDDYLLIVLHFPLFDPATRLTHPNEVDFFVGSDYIITVHDGDLRPLNKLFQDCAHNEAMRQQLMSQSSGFLLYRVVSSLVDSCFPILNQLIDSVDNIETTIFDTRSRERARILTEIRREILAYRRMVRPQIDVLELMEKGEYPFLKVDPDVYFGDLADRIRSIWVELEDLKETVEGLHDTHVTLATIRTNEVIRVLTVIFTVTLPVTMLGTIYGMNVRLPLESQASAFAIMVGIMVAATAGLVAFMRARRWI